MLFSFSYKTQPPPEGYFIIDCRVLKNPWNIPELRKLDGNDEKVVNWLLKHDKKTIEILLKNALEHYKNGEKIAFGCFGGVHRNVAMVKLFKDRV